MLVTADGTVGLFPSFSFTKINGSRAERSPACQQTAENQEKSDLLFLCLLHFSVGACGKKAFLDIGPL